MESTGFGHFDLNQPNSQPRALPSPLGIVIIASGRYVFHACPMHGAVANFLFKKTCMCINPSPESLSNPFALGIAFMDESHQMLHEQLDQLSSVSDADFPSVFEALLQQVRDHFKAEEQAMEEIAFPGIACHRDQHGQALNALRYANLRVKEGAVAEGREIGGLFSQWLTSHITTMDRMLASVMQPAETQEGACAAA
ncbi:hemerythrin family protein [Janthinobacterium sp. 17J80-10]|uniref:bacteriohemerythrin n=1 Tax=Janthinobacterium sp. 17J80-10 TaxID=2497863 RepID=UPI00100535B4|nr:hemerythrin family protein [Janthinobacterium sp. 17J80-10]QAU33107.1 hypothetical protein EKL02_02345 [Janthinobacterium sp. 17J80-10]